jgi:serine/threonine protein kinase
LIGIDPDAAANDPPRTARPESRRQLRDSCDCIKDLPMIEPNQDDVQESRDRATSTKPSPSAQSTVIGRFKIVRFLAQGSYCRVYEVTASDAIDQRLALKLVDRETESVSRWFEKVASVTASLNHAHILPCHESGQIDGRPYMVMPLVDGVSVYDLARQQALAMHAEGRFRSAGEFVEELDAALSVPKSLRRFTC